MKILVPLLVLATLVACSSPSGSDSGGGSTVLTVTYHGNGNDSGDAPVDSHEYENGETVDVYEEGDSGTLVKADYTLGGWNTKADGTGTSHGFGDFFSMGSSKVDLYAVWIPDTLDFDSDGLGIEVTGFSGAAVANLVIPPGVTRIGIYQHAFQDETTITSVSLPASLEEIGQFAFAGCTGLTSVTIPNKLESLPWASFADCTSLTSVTLGSGVETISNLAFSGDESLETLTSLASVPPEISEDSEGVDFLEDASGDISIYVPSSKVNAYKAAAGWSVYASAIFAD